MKVTQDKEFKPVSITLETKEEAETFWEIVRESKRLSHHPNNDSKRIMLNYLSNAFSNQVSL